MNQNRKGLSPPHGALPLKDSLFEVVFFSMPFAWMGMIDSFALPLGTLEALKATTYSIATNLVDFLTL